MRTGIVTTSFPRHPGDFAGCFVEDDLQKRLAADPVEEFEVVAADAHGESDERADLAPRARVVRVRIPPALRDPSAPLFYGAGAPETLESGRLRTWMEAAVFSANLYRTIAAKAPGWDRIVAHWLLPCAAAAKLAAPRLPIEIHVHSGDVALLERLPGGAAVARWLACPPSQLVFASADLRARFGALARFGGERAMANATLRGPLEHEGWDAARARVKWSQQTRDRVRRELALPSWTVLAIGRLVPIKGFDRLLIAVARAAAESATPIAVVILGDGPERERLVSLGARLEVDLRLAGLVPRADVSRWLAAADVYAQPSRKLANGRTEGMPVALGEALAAGLPAVATATGGMTELAERWPTLTLVKDGDVDALAAALLPAGDSDEISRAARNEGGTKGQQCA